MSEAVAAGPVVHSPSHPLHAGARLWPETNCYADVWIELLHWAELDPVASFFYALGMDWEGDQFTFFKPPHEDLRTLYGIEVQELALWKPLEVHVEEQCALGRVVLVEADSFWLPDTAGTTYREGRTKSTIGAWRIDRPSRQLWYFHGAGSYRLEGDDYDGALMRRADQQVPPVMAPYAEIVKLGGVERVSGSEQARRARHLLAKHVRRMPKANPFAAYAAAFDGHQAWLMSESLERFHQYAFVTVRQAGACWLMVADHLAWHADRGLDGLDGLEGALGSARTITETCKSLQMALARATHRRRPMDASASLATLAREWTRCRDALAALLPTLERA